MAHWLIKTEPGSWSWDDQVKKGVEGWDGVRNHQAAKNLKTMQIGDLAFFYHSVNEKRIVGIVEVVREAYPDPTDATGKFVQVDFKTVKPVPNPVTLADIKADPRFAELPLLRQSRLSVMPIDDASWKAICEMGGVSA
ncbi:ubiquinol-cytochrome C reductase [Thalassospira lucentensis]|jgi:predicted RNA-binding protein with PUA-like domain|uniref:Predicted RNA-binding protein, contains PUA-like domain n=3 Tax=Thalassospira TaxID=168934 RepID=A0A285T9V6_9PROT|nr:MULTISPECIES: EVE domain-containing protein [Thalassospira]UKV14308.1 EVE domain-containing protein [Thalassospiraceae bacterium SW-3-3]KZB66971.1 ubiquinol-cytochrome C reductase [Thalassospira lucentensis]MAZ33650.1 EVE domain-containing protein [Thalassospira sp.]MCH2273618.1 EVE domain-containing protein [Thalassospira sp.]MCK2168222.1 EVE domain-containing protein [Thalassospira xiamenensis]